jgi:hypothetical protein
MLERGNRAVSTELASKTVELFEVPATALPFKDSDTSSHDDSFFASALGALGYSGFSHFRGAAKSNAADFLMNALDRDNLDPRVTEALPWLPVAYPEMDWDRLTRSAKLGTARTALVSLLLLPVRPLREKETQVSPPPLRTESGRWSRLASHLRARFAGSQ